MARSSYRLAVGALLALATHYPAAGEQAAAGGPNPRTAKPVVAEYSPDVPPVFLSGHHAGLCRVLVAEKFPAIELPRIDADRTKLATFAGQHATVVLFWKPGQWMSKAALRDIARDVAAKARDSSVGIVGVVVGGDTAAAQQELSAANAKFSQLVDADGTAIEKVGAGSTPRVYVLDGDHRIAWFDLEYSEATRRELQQVLAALTAKR